MTNYLCLYVVLLGLCIPISAYATTTSVRVANAAAALSAGDYRAALHEYEALIASGHRNGHVFYNMGIAYYRLQKTGEAMAAFLTARYYLPRDADVAFNLSYVQSTLADNLKTEIPRKFYDLVGLINDYLTRKEVGIGSLLLWGAGLLLLILYMFKRQLVFVFKLGILLIVLAALSAIFLQARDYFAKRWGAVSTADADVYSGASENDTKLYILKQGSPFRIEGKRGGFWKIILSDGKRGWLPIENTKVYLP